jgi:type III restriction enzyme
VDRERLDEVAARLDLRAPNREAVENLAMAVNQHHGMTDVGPLECVLDVATGVGKTYILAGALEYFAAAGVRNFAVITPGRTILEKTVGNFTAGHAKSLVGSMSSRPLVVTSENFNTPAMRSAMDDDTVTKLYVFTVQSLIKPTTKVGRRTHAFQEGLGEGFYGHLAGLDDLVVFADEHHTYYGAAFSTAIRDLNPHALVGLTGTPHKKTPPEQVIYRYPLAAAIADRLVKTPVIVGRRDDRNDDATKLADGLALLERKQDHIDRYVETNDVPVVHAVMLVVARTIDEANDYATLVRSEEVAGGKWADSVLVVTSESPEDDLAALEAVEEPDSPVRVIVAVDKLKEGWDVKNVYVIASMRALVSDILAEQTLGRGLRLPWGHYTDVEFLDTVEVLAHDRYEALLKKADVLNEAFVDHRTRLVEKRDADGNAVAVRQDETVKTDVIPTDDGSEPDTETPRPVIAETTARTGRATDSLERLTVEHHPRAGLDIRLPKVKQTPVPVVFSLSDIIDFEPFRRLGSRLATNPETELRRMLLEATVVEGPDGFRTTRVRRTEAVDHIEATAALFPMEQLRAQLVDAILAAPNVTARSGQAKAAGAIVDAFTDGMGDDSEATLSPNLARATARLVDLVMDEQRRLTSGAPTVKEDVELTAFAPVRVTDKATTDDRRGRFAKSAAYTGWKRSVYDVASFDSEPERHAALIADAADGVEWWLRLHRNDLPITWDGTRTYNPDLLVAETDGTRLVIEIKSDRESRNEDVQAKRTAAAQWANHVTNFDGVDQTWRYLLVTEADLVAAKDSWAQLKALAVD